LAAHRTVGRKPLIVQPTSTEISCLVLLVQPCLFLLLLWEISRLAANRCLGDECNFALSQDKVNIRKTLTKPCRYFYVQGHRNCSWFEKRSDLCAHVPAGLKHLLPPHQLKFKSILFTVLCICSPCSLCTFHVPRTLCLTLLFENAMISFGKSLTSPPKGQHSLILSSTDFQPKGLHYAIAIA